MRAGFIFSLWNCKRTKLSAKVTLTPSVVGMLSSCVVTLDTVVIRLRLSKMLLWFFYINYIYIVFFSVIVTHFAHCKINSFLNKNASGFAKVTLVQETQRRGLGSKNCKLRPWINQAWLILTRSDEPNLCLAGAVFSQTTLPSSSPSITS